MRHLQEMRILPEPPNAATQDLLRAVDQGAQLARWIQTHGSRAREKADQTPLTVADLAVQAVVTGALERAFPGDPVVAEEDASALEGDGGDALASEVLHFVRPFLGEITRARLSQLLDLGAGLPGDRYWVLDPVDGTEGFLRGGHYVVALALLEHGRPTTAILGCPTLDPAGPVGATTEIDIPGGAGCLLVAHRGRGTWMSPLEAADFIQVRVSTTVTLREARMLRPFAESHIDVDATNRFVQAAGIERPPILMDSQAKHAVIVLGRADLLVRIPATPTYRERVWDHAAGALAIEEAGGRVTDLAGRPPNFGTGRLLERNEGLVASNGLLHPSIIDALVARSGPG
jgi:HAL2 family 3'(2'),5'-bisphosphate nucleotidase